MIKIKENNLNVRFLNHGLVYIIFYNGSHLSRHLLREITVISKVNFGSSPSGYIFSVDNDSSSELFKEIYHKATRMENKPIAVVVKKMQMPAPEIANLNAHPAKVFESSRGAITWIRKTRYENLPSTPFIQSDYHGAASV